MSDVVTILNQKGGCGKSSTCHHLSGAFAASNKRVLLLDCDPQSSLTQGLWGPAATRQLDPASTITSILRGDRPHPAMVVHPTPIPGVDLVPGSRSATSFNIPDPHLTDEESRSTIREFLDEVRDGYDIVLLDNAPNLHLNSWSSMAASDFLVVPLQPEDYGAQGIADVLESLDRVQDSGSPIRLLGYLLTMVSPRRTLHQIYEEQLRSLYGDLVFTARVHEAAEFPEAISRRQTIHQYKPKGAPAKAIRALADEMMARIEAAGSARGVAA